MRDIRWKCIFRANQLALCSSNLLWGALIPLRITKLLLLWEPELLLSLKEIGEMACVTPARSSRGHTLNQSCSFTYPSKESQIVHYCIPVGLLLVLPLSIGIFSHYKIFLKTKEHQYDVV